MKIAWINDDGTVAVENEVVRLAIATLILSKMVDTPTHGLTGQASKAAKVEAAFDYADLLMKG